jgi:L-alanine-DL-glutamate epimerase-like enolase superfamily enzyme
MNLSWRTMRLRPKYRFATSRGGIDERCTMVVELEHDGIVGLGEVVPSALYGQSIESAEAALGRCDELLGDDLFAIEPILARLIDEFDDQRAVIAAIDSALYDWAGKKLGVSCRRLLGLAPARTRTTYTIGVASVDECREKLRDALDRGFDAIKVKVGSDHDAQTLDTIRALFDGPLIMDANSAWSAAEAPDRIRALAAYQPALIEDPVRREEWQAMRELRGLGVAPIFADETCERPADVVRLREHVDGVNIKLPKCGGMREALSAITLARAFGLKVMLGCFVSSSLAIAPSLTIASLTDFADLDGHELLAEDPYSGIDRDGGFIEIKDRPGLGITPRA